VLDIGEYLTTVKCHCCEGRIENTPREGASAKRSDHRNLRLRMKRLDNSQEQ
jgi:hypothetical protein